MPQLDGSDRTAERLLFLLKTRGEQTTRQLAEALGISVPAVRQHVGRMSELLVRSERVLGVGRPAQVWRLSERGHERFPDTHADVTLQLIEAVQETFGDAGLEAVVGHRYERALADYRQGMAGLSTLPGRLRRLARLRSDEGYMAEVTRVDDGWLLVENHCPICVAAAACQGFCANELRMFQSLLDGAQVERVEYVLDGDQRCAYLVKAVGDAA
jgi:predicted ArsR family transcriptional regulator